MRKIELLAPAGNVEKMEMAFHYGADAVYLGGELFSLRAGSNNFNSEELKQTVEYAHSINKKIYVAVNIIPHNNELEIIPEYIRFLESIIVDGVIVADLGVFQIVKENSNLNISVSTQASNTNWRSVDMWRQLGAKRIVLARELSLENITEIRRKVPNIELEVFVHGAMCMSISGRCLLSNYMTGRDANRGDCAQSCRWKYSIVEESRPGQYMPVYEDKNGTHIFNSKDLCTIEFIDKILDLGVDSVKIEGRMKGIYYVANTVKIYRKAIDAYKSNNYKYDENWLKELETISHRKYTDGFYNGKTDKNSQNYDNRNSYSQTHQLVAKVIEKISDREFKIAVRNKLYAGEELEVITTNTDILKVNLPILQLINKTGELTMAEEANPNSFAIIKFEHPVKMEKLDMIRKKYENN